MDRNRFYKDDDIELVMSPTGTGCLITGKLISDGKTYYRQFYTSERQSNERFDRLMKDGVPDMSKRSPRYRNGYIIPPILDHTEQLTVF